MGLTRKFLKDLGVESDAIDSIIDEHRKTVDSLRDDLDKLNTEMAAKKETEKELENLKKAAEENDSYKEKYEDTKKKFDEYKQTIAGEKELTKKTDAYRKALKEAGISDKRIDSVIRLAKADGILDGLEFDGDNIKNHDKVLESIKESYGEYIETISKVGAPVPDPPTKTNPNTFESMTLADKMAYANEHPNAPEVTSWLKGE